MATKNSRACAETRRSLARVYNSFRASLAAVLLTILIEGCGGSVTILPDTTGSGGNLDSSLTSTLGKEPNDFFSQAIATVFDSQGAAELLGTVAVAGDLDIYSLGTLAPGDRVIIDAATAGSELDISIGVFDDQERLVYTNDDRGGPADRFLDSYIDWVVRHAGTEYYLVATHSAFAGQGTFTGTYTIDVSVTSGSPVPQPKSQTIVLDFDGAFVDSLTLGSITIPAFDAGAISPVYATDTQTIKDMIRATFVQNFARFNVTILTTDDSPLPDESTVSMIHFGGFDNATFGIAENVDLYNVDFCDDAIVFSESFATNMFSMIPTAVEMGIAIGNVGSHEAGHLLGLNHVDDDRALMDDKSAADAFLSDQEYIEAPVSSDVIRIGTQDAALLLSEIVGLTSGASLKQSLWLRQADSHTPSARRRLLPSSFPYKRRTSRIKR